RITTPSKTFSSQRVPVDFAGPDHRSNRIDLEIYGIFHGEASYEGRIFFNNPNADRNTPKTPEYGYAGSFQYIRTWRLPRRCRVTTGGSSGTHSNGVQRNIVVANCTSMLS